MCVGLLRPRERVKRERRGHIAERNEKWQMTDGNWSADGGSLMTDDRWSIMAYDGRCIRELAAKTH